MKRIIPLLVCALMCAGISGYGTDAGWRLAVDKEGIKVYTRPAPGCPLDEFRGITEIKTTVDTIERILRDVNAQPVWMADCLQSGILKQFDNDHLVCYNVLDMPWPLSDRDLLIDTCFKKENGGKKLIVDMSVFAEDITPVNQKYVRVRDFRARCSAEQVTPDTCLIEYVNRVNPMAPVPDAIANSIAKNNPFNTLKGMKRMVSEGRYNR